MRGGRWRRGRLCGTSLQGCDSGFQTANSFVLAREGGRLKLVGMDETTGDGLFVRDGLFKLADEEVVLDAGRDGAGVIVDLLLGYLDQLGVAGALRGHDPRTQLELLALLDGGVFDVGTLVRGGDGGGGAVALDGRDELGQSGRGSGRIGGDVRVGRSGRCDGGSGSGVGVGVVKRERLGGWGVHEWKVEMKQ